MIFSSQGLGQACKCGWHAFIQAIIDPPIPMQASYQLQWHGICKPPTLPYRIPHVLPFLTNRSHLSPPYPTSPYTA